ncbi:nucleoside 2-deoxyribosyltransferase [Clostridium sp. TF11-13AC]|uniref:nucleoside 2-deoxyribosyltransferase n=1 Tax=Clostridium sp. TF11-13AC TaxID=2293053 RepID=UPI000E490C98|nr:nucleoside 2-deoxyribosyltransferase [Clostridium sp. TF11-13AC]RHU42081.1 hypothetical protein DXD12_13655 [Clostridium sp. TF11-13AC]
MNKIFIACPFIKYVDGTGFTNESYKKFTEDLYELCLRFAHSVFLALKREEYGAKPLDVYSCKMDLDELINSDIIIALPDDSMGVAVELGWASAYNKFIVLLLNEKQNYSALVKNITTITPGHIIWYNDEGKNALPEIDSFLETIRVSKGDI